MSHAHALSSDGGAGATLRRLLAADGTAAHAYAAALAAPRAPARDLGDAIHALCTVHGHHPDLLAVAAALGDTGDAHSWLAEAAAGFTAERAVLAQLVAAAGPLPSTPGQAETSAALTAERHAMEMLARSERVGVALGAAAALVGDWQPVRAVLARAAERFGITLPATMLPPVDAVLARVPERAAAFGAQQLLAQHRGLWSLLEARSSARSQ
ncbi:DUF6975 family protein [Sphingomonas sp.]|uniref:DUF6975 family protein n=1 Tax=Sphingomonas sp. TaxID=28214 RepID=UPI003CC5D800